MTDIAPSAKKRPYDIGVDEGAKRLTPDRIEKVINAIINGETGARLKSYVQTCVHCGLCSDACHYYQSHQDPIYSPVGKVKQTLWEMVKKKGRVSAEFMIEASKIASTECNLCRRCVHYCPMGIDIAYLMIQVRRICSKLGITPQYIQDTTHSHATTMNQMWVKDDEWPDTLLWQEEEAQGEFPDLRIPLDKEGADVFYSVIGPEPKFQAGLIYQAACIMNAAGIDWTMPSLPGWDNSDMCMFTGDFEMCGRIKRSHFESAMKLKVKRIVMGECGHAFRSVYDVGNRWLGWKMHPIPIVHAIEFFAELFREGKIRLAKKYDKTVTIHDPCNVIRGRGLADDLRYVMGQLCENVVEMHPNREHNYCCCAGGGVINCGPPFRNTRTDGNKIKAEQVKMAISDGAEVLMSPCHNCHSGLEDIFHAYKIEIPIKFIGDVIYECMEKP